MNNSNRAIVVYKQDLLPLSETFIRDQAEALERFTPVYAGRRRMKGLDLAPDRTFVINQGGFLDRLREGMFQIFRTDRRLLDSLAHFKPVLCHAHFEGGGIAALRLSRALRIPHVVNCWGWDVCAHDEQIMRNPLLRPWYRRRRRELQAKSDLFLTCSNFLKSTMVRRGYPEDKIVVHYIGIDTTKFAPDPSVPRERLVLFVARLVEKKGCEYLLRAMAEVQKKIPDAELVVIGDGPLRPSLEALARESLPRCRFLGAQTTDVIRQWLRRAAVFCVPSITASTGDAEGLGSVFLEAQASGLPCASFRHGGIPEAVADGETGLLANEKDWQGLAANLLLLLKDQALWETFSKAARNRAVEMFDLRSQTLKVENYYDDAINRHK